MAQCCNIFKVMLMNSHLQASSLTSQHMALTLENRSRGADVLEKLYSHYPMTFMKFQN